MSCEAQKNKSISNEVGRCVVTGTNSSGKSSILTDGPGVEDLVVSGPKIKSTFLWIEEQVPVQLNDNSNPLRKTDLNFLPPSEGLSARLMTCEPGFYADYHQTDTIDLIVIVSGQIELILDEGSTVLNVGETVIQRGTNHAWRVYGEEPCTIVAIMISAEKK
jgi:quercetin dioxygenase-like cupin family protein